MQVIAEDKILTVSGTNEDSNYPWSNVSDDHPKKVGRSTTTSGIITLTVAGGSNALFLCNTNCSSITVTIASGTATEYSLSGIDTYLELIQDSGEAWTMIWIDCDYEDSEHTITLDFTAPSVNAEIGVIRAGFAYQFDNPTYGLQEGLKDYSIVKELNNGAFYTRKRDIVRTFSGSFLVKRDTDFYTFMQTIIQGIGPEPRAWKITTLDNWDWAVFARLVNMPQGNHVNITHSRINFSLQEVV